MNSPRSLSARLRAFRSFPCLLLGALSLLSALPSWGRTIVALTEANEILVVDADTPRKVLSGAPIANLVAGEIVLGIDMRPANGQLYALTAQAGNASPRLLTIDPNTGVATLVAALSATVGDDNLFVALTGSRFSLDFDPVADRLRVVSNMGQNLRINPTDATVTTDTALAFAVDDPKFGAAPRIVATAHTPVAAGATKLYAIDDVNFKVAEQTPPNNGTLNSKADFGLANVTHPGYDIAPDGSGYVAEKHTLPNQPVEYILATLNPLTGASESRGPIGDGTIAIRDIAVVTSLAFSAPVYSIVEEGGSAIFTVRRDGLVNKPVSVDFTTLSDSASAATDYTTTAGTLTFAASDVTKTFQVPIKNDAFPEADEFLDLLLTKVTAAAGDGPPVLGRRLARLRIDANDRPDKVGPRVVSVGLTGPSQALDGAVIYFSEDMDMVSVTDLANYSLTTMTAAKKMKKLAFTSAVYDPEERKVTLAMAGGVAQNSFVRLALRIVGRGTSGVRDSRKGPTIVPNLLDGIKDGKPGGDFVQAFKVVAGAMLKFNDRDGDKVTLALTGGGRLDGLLPLGGPPAQQPQFWIVNPVALMTSLQGTVTQSARGDGELAIAELAGLEKKELFPISTNPAFRIERLTFSPEATGLGLE